MKILQISDYKSYFSFNHSSDVWTLQVQVQDNVDNSGFYLAINSNPVQEYLGIQSSYWSSTAIIMDTFVLNQNLLFYTKIGPKMSFFGYHSTGLFNEREISINTIQFSFNTPCKRSRLSTMLKIEPVTKLPVMELNGQKTRKCWSDYWSLHMTLCKSCQP